MHTGLASPGTTHGDNGLVKGRASIPRQFALGACIFDKVFTAA